MKGRTYMEDSGNGKGKENYADVRRREAGHSDRERERKALGR